ESEEAEVVYQETRDEHESPARPEDGLQEPAARRMTDVPDDGRNRQPLPEEEPEEKAALEHVRAPLHRGRHELRPPSLERGPGHDAMRDGGEEKQQRIDEEGGRAPGRRPRVNRLRDEDISDEADRVEKRGQEDEIAGHAANHGDSSPRS